MRAFSALSARRLGGRSALAVVAHWEQQRSRDGARHAADDVHPALAERVQPRDVIERAGKSGREQYDEQRGARGAAGRDDYGDEHGGQRDAERHHDYLGQEAAHERAHRRAGDPADEGRYLQREHIAERYLLAARHRDGKVLVRHAEGEQHAPWCADAALEHLPHRHAHERVTQVDRYHGDQQFGERGGARREELHAQRLTRAREVGEGYEYGRPHGETVAHRRHAERDGHGKIAERYRQTVHYSRFRRKSVQWSPPLL